MNLIRSGLLLIALLMTPAAAFATELETGNLPDDLAPYRWQNRILIIRAPGTTDPSYREQAAALVAAYPGLVERDLRVFTAFGVERFSIELIGKDGGTKERRNTVLPPAELFAIIDAMPMRRAEMRRESRGP